MCRTHPFGYAVLLVIGQLAQSVVSGMLSAVAAVSHSTLVRMSA
ncbi:MAG: hypothetical protein ACKVI4_17140 [Actinomycetales bacterium]